MFEQMYEVICVSEIVMEDVRKLGKSLGINMSSIMRSAGFKVGDVVKIVVKDGEVVIKRVKVFEDE